MLDDPVPRPPVSPAMYGPGIAADTPLDTPPHSAPFPAAPRRDRFSHLSRYSRFSTTSASDTAVGSAFIYSPALAGRDGIEPAAIAARIVSASSRAFPEKYTLSPNPEDWSISPALLLGLVPDPEADDDLHAPDPARDKTVDRWLSAKGSNSRVRLSRCGCSNIVNVLALALVIGGLMTLFLGYPLISHFAENDYISTAQDAQGYYPGLDSNAADVSAIISSSTPSPTNNIPGQGARPAGASPTGLPDPTAT